MLYIVMQFNRNTLISQRRIVWLNFLKQMVKLAWNLLSKSCANLLDFLKNFINSQDFLEQSRKNDKDFCRQRKLPFVVLVLFFCNFLKSSYQAELNKFFKILSDSAIAKKVVSKAALCNARKKLKYQAFTAINDQAVTYFNQNFAPKTWHGFFLKAVDGSTVKVPDYSDITEHFGVLKPRQGEPVPMARISQMFDPLNKITTHALIGPKGTGEREMAASHFEHLNHLDLVLLDRGYPAYWIFKLILFQCAHFCSRISSKKWKVVRKFIQSGKREQLITLEIPLASIASCTKRNLDTLPMRLRLIRIELESGETEVLITSLTDMEQYPYELFAELYHDRWPVEEDYKIMKCRIEIENFSGQSELSVYQDFHARVLSKNITMMLAHAAQESVEQKTGHRQLPYKINITHALSTMRDSIVLLFHKTGDALQSFMDELLDTFTSALEPIRPGRSNPRNHKRSQRKYSHMYKPVL